MIRQIDFSELRGVDLIPQAIVKQPAAYFTAQDIHFAEDEDDLDSYEGAALYLEGGPRFALMHYPGYPDGTMTIYLPPECQSVDLITQIVKQILQEFRLSTNALLWQRADGPEL